MGEAVSRDAEAQQALLDRRAADAQIAFRAASELYRQSWEQAPPRSYGRLVGMLKSAVLGDAGRDASTYVRTALANVPLDSPTAAYALAVAALIDGDDEVAGIWVARMRGGSEPLERTADAIGALAAGDAAEYERAIAAIVGDFEQREQHLTGVAIADTALMLEQLAAPRGITTAVRSPLLPRAND
jgi:hypothetical protein